MKSVLWRWTPISIATRTAYVMENTENTNSSLKVHVPTIRDKERFRINARNCAKERSILYGSIWRPWKSAPPRSWKSDWRGKGNRYPRGWSAQQTHPKSPYSGQNATYYIAGNGLKDAGVWQLPVEKRTVFSLFPPCWKNMGSPGLFRRALNRL